MHRIGSFGSIGHLAGDRPSGSSAVTKAVTLATGETTTLKVGTAETDLAIFLTYTALRGTQSAVGEIIVGSPFQDVVEPPVISNNFNLVGMTITANIIDGDILLNIAVNAASASDITFSYTYEIFKGTKIINPSMVFVSEGATFSPVIEVEAGTTVLWEFADGTTSTAVNPTVDYTTTASRQNRLTVFPWSGLVGINIGYDGSDGGWATPAHLAQQNVSSITGMSLAAASLEWFTCNRNPNLTFLDFTNFENMIQMEAYDAGLVNINLTGCTALRRLCLETCRLVALDISDCLAIEDIRGALNQFSSINFGSVGAYFWHICIRNNNYTSNIPHPRQFPMIREFFLWTSQQTGHLDMTENPRCTSVQVYQNQYTSADFRGAFTINGGSLDISNNLLTSLLVSNCPFLGNLNASNNDLSDSAICQVLVDMDANGRTNGTLTLTGNSVPIGAEGLAAITSLQGKGWTVTVDTV